MSQQMPPVTKNLLIINVLMFAAQYVFERSQGIDLVELFGLHFVLADDFSPYQLFTYMFLHGSFTHLFFNMFSLWMFGRIIENVMEGRRFLLYYVVCGVGAGLCQELWQAVEYFQSGLAASDWVPIGYGYVSQGAYLNLWTTIGASGACYGILLAFGMTFPNERIMLIIPPIPMKAKYFVFGYAVIELMAAFHSDSNIAHFAHLGGMLFGFLLLLYWKRRGGRGGGRFEGWDTWQPPSARRKDSLFGRIKEWMGRKPGKKAADDAPRFKDRNADYDYNARRKEQEERIDRILDKIRRSGYESLTEEEKQELFRNSRK